MPFSHSQIIEHFHLTFLDVLRTKVDVGRYVLKGGANLRYFFNSVRYSEDIDLDVTGADWRFDEQVDKVLYGDTLSRLLRAVETAVVPEDPAAQTKQKNKRTGSTHRWRVQLTSTQRAGEQIRTKIEFSSRNGETRYALDKVPSEVVAPYAMRPPSVQHYLLMPATEQKVIALAKRPETQARDVFDLDTLLRSGGLVAGAVDDAVRQTAAEAAVALTWQDFETQVVPFLEPSVVAIYDQAAWNTTQDYVAGELLK